MDLKPSKKLSQDDNQDHGEQFTFQTFTGGDISQIKISVKSADKKIFKYVEYQIDVTSPFFSDFSCYKRYNEFHAMYKVLKIKYQNINLPEFPGRYQLFNKVENRITKFHLLMNKLMEYAQLDTKIQHNLLSLIYVFLTKNLSNKKKKQIGYSYGQNSRSQDLSASDISTIMPIEEHKTLQKMLTKECSDDEDGDSIVTLQDGSLNNQRKLRKNSSQEYTYNSDVGNNSNQKQAVKFSQSLDPSQAKEYQIQSPTNQLQSPKSNLQKINEEENGQSIITNRQTGQVKEFKTDEIRHPKKTLYFNQITNHPDLTQQNKKFNGTISISYGDGGKWEKYHARINGTNLNLYSHIFENHPTLIVSLYKINIEKHEKFQFMLKLSHKKDCKKMLLSVCEPQELKELMENQKQAELLEEPIEIKKWKVQLEFAAKEEDKQMIKTDDRPERFLGKVFLKIHEVQGLNYLKDNTTVFIRIRSYPYTYQTREQICLQNLKWRQEFVFPFIDLFESIKIEVISSINQGWIKDDVQERILGSVSIPVQDFVSRNNDYVIEKKKIILEQSEWRQKQLQKLDDQIDLKLIFSLRNMCSPGTLYTTSPANYNEGQNLQQDLSEFFKIMKITFIRFKRMIGSIGLLREWEYYIFFFRYKRFSILSCIVMCFLTLTLDLNNILSYLLFLIVFFSVLYSPFVQESLNVNNFKEWLFEKNPDYLEPQLYIIDVWDYITWSQGLEKVKKILDDEKDIEEKNLGIVGTYELAKQQIYKMNQWFLHFSNFYEKFKNIFTWADYKRSFYVVILGSLTLYVFWNLPLRYLIFLAIIKKFACGQQKHKDRVEKNRQIAELTIKYLIKTLYPQKQGFIYEKCLEEPWPSDKKKEEALSYHLNLYLDDNLMNEFNKPIKMINAIKTCSYKLVLIKKAVGHYQKYKNDLAYQELRKKCKWEQDWDDILLKRIKNFIFNMPSDLFRIQNPKII